MGPLTYFSVEEVKALRVQTDALIQKIELGGTHKQAETDTQGPFTSDGDELYSMASYQARVKLIEAKMWLGKMLEGRGNPFPKEIADKANTGTASIVAGGQSN